MPEGVPAGVANELHDVPLKRTSPSAVGIPAAFSNCPQTIRSPPSTTYWKFPTAAPFGSQLQPGSMVQVLPSYAMGSRKPEISFPFQTVMEKLLKPPGTACHCEPSQRCIPPVPVNTDA